MDTAPAGLRFLIRRSPVLVDPALLPGGAVMARWLASPPDLFQATRLLFVLGIVRVCRERRHRPVEPLSQRGSPFGPSSEGNDFQARQITAV